MAFLSTKQHPNGSVSQAHKVASLEIKDGAAIATVNSFATEAAMNAAPALIVWQDRYPVPITAALDVETFLIGQEGPFAGGFAVTEGTSLEAARERRWAEIKQERDKKEASGFPYLGAVFDSDPRSVQRIVGAVLAAQAAVAAGETFEIEWTVADNSVLPLDASDVMGMPVALAMYADQLHTISRGLRADIEAAATVEEVEAVTWPVPTPAPVPEAGGEGA
ncbi:DUF4376 domain-containing protein [Variovorax paradoxus]|uniref:DUF4376 domain-containing protein n=1 Tax=Variovorax paradoxus TaxID=34073 RepID=A0A5Q0M8A9_VARPD|nr:DUF4376 domain-containing protein [Variovorax paradoxus]QFZ84632.1 DUF4376 domain-containing protein [Variovorax paradoxus]